MLLATFLVTNTGDNGGVNPLPGAGTGTLRQAIVDANAAATGTAASPDLIQFNIPSTDPGYNSTTGAFTIQPLSALPTITDIVDLNGYTQPGASPNTLSVGDNAVINIVVNGDLAGAVDGLVIAGGNSTVRGLVIDNFASGSAFVLKLNGSDVVAGDFVGTDVTGEAAAADYVGIVTNPNEPILSTGNTIGGDAPVDRNIISGNNYIGIDIDNANLIEGNYIGTDRSGTYAVANGTGIVVGSNNTIGGMTTTPGAGAGNVISGNTGFGIQLGNQNLVAGNVIGTTATGLAALGNSGGILGGSYNTIGGTTPGARNIISGNTSGGIADPGVSISGPYNLIEGNYIGTDITGTTLLGNPGGGIVISSSYNTIGGTTAAARNTISNGFAGNPIGIAQGGGQPPVLGNMVQGNYIGTDVTGTQALPNETGIVLTGGVYDTLIGGTVPGASNVISGNNNESLIILQGEDTAAQEAGDTDIPTNTLIQGNFIGTDKSGAMLLGDHGNAETGIYIVDANNTTIGGTVPGAGNTIAFNGGYGVYINAGSGNSILGNSIFANSPLGISLNSTNNANNNQAAPVVSGGSGSLGGTRVSGTLATVANTTFRIEFFANQGLDSAGNAEGQTFLGFATVTTDASGYLASSPGASAVITNPDTAGAAFTATNLAALSAGEGFVTATATNQTTGDTSQFSNYLAVPTSMLLTSSANPSLFGQAVTLTATVSATLASFGTPVGSVDFVDTTTNTDLGSVALSGGMATLTTVALNSGTHVITATYAGNTTFLGSSATLTETVTPSILVLNPTAGGALSLSGNASINIPGTVVVDSSSKTALTESGNASVKAAGIQVVGGVIKSGNATWSPTPVTGATAVPDPLAALAAPTTGTAQGSVNLSGNSSRTINPGIYTQISVSGKAQLTLNPGVYILAGGGLTVSGSASISGSGVTLYNTESAFPNPGGTYGGVTLSGNGTVSLTAPSSGPDAGVVLFQARTNTRAIALSGNAAAGLGGTVYAPQASREG
jgi:hypothetical protein